MKTAYTLLCIILLSNYCFSDDSSRLSQEKAEQTYNPKATENLKEALWVWYNDLSKAIEALDEGADPMVDSRLGMNAAHHAVRRNDLELLIKYHEKGGNLRVRANCCYDSPSLLDLALDFDHIEQCKFLMKACPELEHELNLKKKKKLNDLLQITDLTGDRHEMTTFLLRDIKPLNSIVEDYTSLGLTQAAASNLKHHSLSLLIRSKADCNPRSALAHATRTFNRSNAYFQADTTTCSRYKQCIHTLLAAKAVPHSAGTSDQKTNLSPLETALKEANIKALRR